MHWPVIIATVVALLFAATLLIVRRRTDRTRAEALQQAGIAMGLSFETDGDLEQMKSLGDLSLYRHGRAKRLKHVLSGRVGADETRVFDYQYTTGGGHSSHTSKQTVALYPGGGQGLPDLMLAPENILHKIGKLLGYQDINFEESPGFSSTYLLRGADETAIRSAFTSDVRAFLEQERGWTVEVQGGNVAIYRSGKQTRAEELGLFLQETGAVLRALAHR